jgi:diadenosine tetraphosphate (Ap4A) HIT family hydrolase
MLAEREDGDWIYSDSAWIACVFPGLEVPGWVSVIARRHAEGIVALEASELASLGGVLSKVAEALHLVVEPKRVYLASFGERYPHFHVLLMARGPQIPPDHRGAALQLHAAEYIDEEAAVIVESRLRLELAVKVEEHGN